MMQFLRKGADTKFVKIALFGLLLAAVSSMVFSDLGGILNNGFGHDLVAKVGRENITTASFQKTVSVVLGRQGIDPVQAHQMGYTRQILEQEIQQRLYKQYANEKGLIIPNAAIADHIASLIDPNVKQGQTRTEALREILKAQHISEPEFINVIESEMKNQLIQDTVLGGLGDKNVPAIESALVGRYQNENRAIRYKEFKSESVILPKMADAATLKKHYESMKDQFLVPEMRDISVVLLTQANIKNPNPKVEDKEIALYYNNHKDNFKTPENYRLSQLIFDKQDSAQKAYDSLKAAGSKDTALIKNFKEALFLDNQNFLKSDLPESLQKALEPMSDKAQYLAPIQSPLGWHVVHFISKDTQKTRPLSEVKAEITKQLQQDLIKDQLNALSDELDDRLANGETLDGLVQDLSLKPMTFKDVTSAQSNDNDALFKDFPLIQKHQDHLLEEAFLLEDNETSPVIALDDQLFALVQVNKINEEHTKPYDQVTDLVKKNWTKSAKIELADLEAKKLSEKINQKPEKDRVLVGKEISLVREKMNDPVSDSPFNAEIQNALFEAQAHKAFYFKTESGSLVAMVENITLPKQKAASQQADKDDIANINRLIDQSWQSEILTEFTNQLYKKYPVKVNGTTFDGLFKPAVKEDAPHDGAAKK